MATSSGAGQRRDTRSAGKMLRPRRTMLPKTPYDRPRVLNSTPQNPNWISSRLFSPTRTIVSGATRVLASVFSFASSSSNSDSSSDDSYDNSDDQDADLTEPQSFSGKIETKHLIEQLLMRETFSREECDKLTNIIKSRVVDSATIKGSGLGKLDETPNKIGGSDVEIHDLCSTAIMEARKWLEENKSGSNSKSELHHGTGALNSVTLTHSVEGESGSPVDLAKSYMRSRPLWASPSTNNIEFRSPSPTGMPLFKEETAYSIGGNSLSLSKKKDSPATSSWNIQDEIRKVRSKATEEMLRTLSSPKTDWSSFALEDKRGSDSLVANNGGPAEEDNPQSSKKSVDASVDLAARPPVSLITQDALHNDALPSPAALGGEQNQGMEAIQSIERKRGPQLEDNNCSALKEVAGIGGVASTANRFPPSGSSMSAEPDKEQNHQPSFEENNAVGSSQENATRVASEGKCELLSEASLEVPSVDEFDAVTFASQDGSPQQLNEPKSKRSLRGEINTRSKKQQVKKVSRYNKRGRGRSR